MEERESRLGGTAWALGHLPSITGAELCPGCGGWGRGCRLRSALGCRGGKRARGRALGAPAGPPPSRPEGATPTILSLRETSSSSSFLRFSKCASISVCSSLRSFSIRFRCMSWVGGGGGTQRRPRPQGRSEALGLWDRLGLRPGCCRTGCPSPRVLPQAWRGWGHGPGVFSEAGAALLELSLTSKSTLSPSGILGGTKLGMKGLVGRRRGEHQALPAQRGCGTRMGRSLSSLQKGQDPATHALTPARCLPRAPTPTRDWGAYSGLMYPHSYLEWKPLISFRKREAQRHKALLKSMQPGSREAWLCTLADPHSWPRPQGPGRRQSASHASPTRCGTPGQDAEPRFPVCPRVWGSEPRHGSVCSNEGLGLQLGCFWSVSWTVC